MLKEDMEAKGPVKVSDVERAQQNILKVCRKLEEEGRIVIAGAGEEMLSWREELPRQWSVPSEA
jgi:flagellar motor switch protein FliG